MTLAEQLERQIQSCVEALNGLVSGKGYGLTHPMVVQKSMELDQLILQAMRKPKR